MIELAIHDRRIEMTAHDPEATLLDLRNAVEEIRSHTSLVTAHCAGCGRCCYDEHLPILGFDLVEMRRRLESRELSQAIRLPEPPAPEERRESVSDLMRQHDLDRTTARLLYEYNAGDPITYARSTAGACRYLVEGFCTNYAHRAYTCSLYACTMGDELSSLQERIVRQGVWHSYSLEGWIAEEQIEHNPFLEADGYDDVPISAFEGPLDEALEALFFYF